MAVVRLMKTEGRWSRVWVLMVWHSLQLVHNVSCVVMLNVFWLLNESSDGILWTEPQLLQYVAYAHVFELVGELRGLCIEFTCPILPISSNSRLRTSCCRSNTSAQQHLFSSSSANDEKRSVPHMGWHLRMFLSLLESWEACALKMIARYCRFLPILFWERHVAVRIHLRNSISFPPRAPMTKNVLSLTWGGICACFWVCWKAERPVHWKWLPDTVVFFPFSSENVVLPLEYICATPSPFLLARLRSCFVHLEKRGSLWKI